MTIKKVGRPSVKRSEEAARRIKAYSACGIPAKEISGVMGMSETTMRKLYAHELKVAATEANSKVAGMLYQQCLDGNITAIIFWLKTRARWSEHAGLDGSSKDVKITIVGGLPD